MQISKEHTQYLLPDEHIYRPLIKKAIPVTTIILHYLHSLV